MNDQRGLVDGQYTNLFDENGRHILIGDLVEIDGNRGFKYRARVIYDDGSVTIESGSVKTIENPEGWDKEYPYTNTIGFDASWGCHNSGGARSALASVCGFSERGRLLKNCRVVDDE